MKIFALGGAGRICRESINDLVEFADFDKITIGDVNLEEARQVANWLNSAKIDVVPINIKDKEEAIKILSDYDIVLDGTTISLNDISTECIAKAGCSGINFNGFGEEYKYDKIFKDNGSGLWNDTRYNEYDGKICGRAIGCD